MKQPSHLAGRQFYNEKNIIYIHLKFGIAKIDVSFDKECMYKN